MVRGGGGDGTFRGRDASRTGDWRETGTTRGRKRKCCDLRSDF